jgi:hypothetical protein
LLRTEESRRVSGLMGHDEDCAGCTWITSVMATKEWVMMCVVCGELQSDPGSSSQMCMVITVGMGFAEIT